MIPHFLADIICCPDCHSDIDLESKISPVCRRCAREFTVQDGILSLLPLNAKALPATYDDPDYQRMSECFDDSSTYFTDGNSLFKSIHESSHKTTSVWEKRWSTDDWTVDIGCGQGYHWTFVKDRTRLIGLDIRMESLRKIRIRFPDAILIQGNLLALPFKREVIARATSIYALEHIYWLDDALTEIARVLKPRAHFLVGVPCEGGLAWSTGRKFTSERTMSKRYNVDYRKYIALEHCNTASKIESALARHFVQIERRLYPLPFVPLIGVNLTLSLALQKRER
jgi:SAM-dependent methyltransferase